MKKTKENYNQVIEEKNQELNILKNNSSISNQSDLSAIVGWLSIFMIFVTIILGGLSSGIGGLLAGLIAAALIFYYFKIKNEGEELNSKIINASNKVEQLKTERDRL